MDFFSVSVELNLFLGTGDAGVLVVMIGSLCRT
jgi:hypothetical protein